MPIETRLTRRFPLAADARLDLKVDNGAITVEGWDRPEAVLELTIRADSAVKLKQVDPQIVAERQGVRLTVVESYPPVRYDYRTGGRGVVFRPAQTLVTLKMPRAAALKLHSHNADFAIDGLLGPIEATTFNGRLAIRLRRDANQSVDAHTFNGRLILPEPPFVWADGDDGLRRRRAGARLGDGQRRVALDAFNGVVEVR